MSGSPFGGGPKYVERADNQSLSQPIALERASIYLFPVESELGRQQGLLDRFLNQPSRGVCDYRAFLPRVFFYAARFGEARALSAPDAEKGFFSYKEAGVFVLAAGTPPMSAATSVGFSLFPYYTFVDESHALATGREVWGFPKELAALEVPEDASVATSFRVAPVVLDRFSPRTMALEEQLFQIAKIPGTGGALFQSMWTDKGAVIAALGARYPGGLSIPVPGAGLVVDVATTLASGPTFAFLKQFRDAEYVHRACHQSGIEARASVQRFRRAGILDGRYALDLRVADSHPMITEMGLDPSTFGDLPGFFVDLDFSMDRGVELWRAP